MTPRSTGDSQEYGEYQEVGSEESQEVGSEESQEVGSEESQEVGAKNRRSRREEPQE